MYRVQYSIGIDEIESLALLDRLVRDVLVLGKAGSLFHIGNSSVKLLILMERWIRWNCRSQLPIDTKSSGQSHYIKSVNKVYPFEYSETLSDWILSDKIGNP